MVDGYTASLESKSKDVRLQDSRRLSVWSVLLLFLFFYPPVLGEVDWLNPMLQLMAAIRYIVSGVMLVSMILNQDDRPVLWLLVLYQLCVVFSAVYTETFYLSYGLSCLTFIGLIAFSAKLIKANQRRFIDNCYWLFFIYLMINAVTEILFSNGLISGLVGDSRVWFLGTKNNITLYYIIFCLLSFIQLNNKRKQSGYNREVTNLVIASASLFIVPSATALVAEILVVLLFVWRELLRQKGISIKLFLGVIVGFFLVVIVLGVQSGVTSFLASFFGKTGTFTGRRAIWEMALEMIASNPLGSGVAVAFNPWGNSLLFVNSAHNTILDIAVRFGIVTAAIFVVSAISIVVIGARGSDLGRISSYFLLVVLFVSMMEANQSSYLLWLIMSFCISFGRSRRQPMGTNNEERSEGSTK